MKLRSAAPVFLVDDVGATLRWYENLLGFRSFPFPKDPPHVFGILERDGVEIMLQRVEGYRKPETYTLRGGGTWDVYLRMSGIRELYAALQERGDVAFIEELHKQPYGDSEFVIRDPNGYVLVFSEVL